MTQLYRADIVVPCYNEEEALPETVPVILDFFAGLIRDPANGLGTFRLILVNDGSQDATWTVITDLAARHPEVEGVMLSRNFGHQNAMLAGLSIAALLSTSLLIEVIMSWPGLGPLLVEALLAKDVHLVLSASMLATGLLVLGNLAADLALVGIDPRIRA